MTTRGQVLLSALPNRHAGKLTRRTSTSGCTLTPCCTTLQALPSSLSSAPPTPSPMLSGSSGRPSWLPESVTSTVSSALDGKSPSAMPAMLHRATCSVEQPAIPVAYQTMGLPPTQLYASFASLYVQPAMSCLTTVQPARQVGQMRPSFTIIQQLGTSSVLALVP